MNLIIDVGNSFTKTYVFDGEKLIDKQNFKNFTYLQAKQIVQDYPYIKNAIVSSVGKFYQEIRILFKELNIKLLELNESSVLPIQNCYSTKSTLGYDRIAAAVGAYTIFPKSNVLVIDIGTAITFDLVNSAAQFVGGNISPGMNMRYRALHQFTEKLPLHSAQPESKLLGNSTETAIVAGVQNGICYELESYIQQMGQEYDGLKVILTGGDAFFFVKKLKKVIFAEPNLVAIGLNAIIGTELESYGYANEKTKYKE